MSLGPLLRTAGVASWLTILNKFFLLVCGGGGAEEVAILRILYGTPTIFYAYLLVVLLFFA